VIGEDTFSFWYTTMARCVEEEKVRPLLSASSSPV